MKGEKLLIEWIAHLKKLSTSKPTAGDGDKFSSREVSAAISNLFEYVTDNELISQMCQQIYNHYRSTCGNIRYQCIAAIPTLIHAYLVSHVDRLFNHEIEACILGIYNLEVTDSEGNVKTEVVKIPDFSACSIYHDPRHLSSPLCGLGTPTDNVVINVGPYAYCKKIDSTNRYSILTRVLQVYNGCIDKCTMISHRQICRVAKRLMTRGFNMEAYGSDATELRIPVYPSLMIEFIQGIYFIIYNGNLKRGQMALHCIHKRAEYEIFPSVIMITSSIMDELIIENIHKFDKLLTLKALKASIAKDIKITNASFRSKKLPEDIKVNGIVDLDPDTQTDSDMGVSSIEGGASKSRSPKRKKNLKNVIRAPFKQGGTIVFPRRNMCPPVVTIAPDAPPKIRLLKSPAIEAEIDCYDSSKVYDYDILPILYDAPASKLKPTGKVSNGFKRS